MSRTQDRVVLATGAILIVVTVVGLAVVEANTGPFEHEIQQASHAAELEGTYTVEDGSASSPVCEVSDDACDPETRIELAVEGLPMLPAGAGYGLFLADGEDDVHVLGPLERSEDQHRSSIVADVDGDAYELLRLSIVDPEDPTTSVVTIHEQPLPTSGGETIALEDAFQATAGSAEGSLSLAQIGAVEVAVTASATIEGLPSVDGWSYEAWLVDDDEAAWTSLGVLDREGETHHLDARIERVTLVEQDRLLITLQPAQLEEGVGFPVVEVAVEADSLWR